MVDGRPFARRRRARAGERKWSIRNIAAVPVAAICEDHFESRYRSAVMPDTAASRHIALSHFDVSADARVKLHRHKGEEQVYHVLDGQDLMQIDGEHNVVR